MQYASSGGDPIPELYVPAVNDMAPTEPAQSLGLSERFRRLGIASYLVIDTALSELNDGMETGNNREKIALGATATCAVGGQIYERLRLPEVLGISATTTVYQEALDHGVNSGVATGLASAALGALVYGQQKIIGKTWVRTAENFPNTYETVNTMWPKTMETIQDAIPSEDNSVMEGAAMFSLGTTPFIASAKAANPNIAKSELTAIEKRVTRRGSVFAATVGATVLGAKSAAVHMPARAGEEAVKWSDRLVDVASNPYIVAGSLAGASALKALAKAGAKMLGRRRTI